MSSSIKTILVIGGTSGIGEAFARRFHADGKRVIVSGRRQERVDALKSEMPGMEGYAMDITDVAAIPTHVDRLIKSFSDINTVWVNAGVGSFYTFNELSNTTDDKVQQEILTNATAPTLLARHFLPHLIAQGSEANFMVTSGGTGFCPVGMMGVYSATKAYIHSLCVSLRQQLKDTNVNVIEIVPPLVETGLGATPNNPGRSQFQSLPLEDYVKITFDKLDSTPAKDLKEVSAGTGQDRVDAWRAGMGPMLAKMGLSG